MADSTRLDLGVGLELAIRSSLVEKRPCMVLSSGYGRFGYDEPIQLALIDALEEIGVGWIQYEYVERNANNPTTDLLISSGLHALRAACGWARARVTGPIGLFGISFGANISLEAALVDRPAIVLVVNPVFDYVEYRRQQLGLSAMERWAEAGATVITYDQDVRSYHRFIEEARHQDLLYRCRHIACKVVACQGEADPILGTRYLERFATACPQAQVHVIPGADHAYHDPDAIRHFVRIATSALNDWYRPGLLPRAA
jgi:pimeloyl-ACP methyl ester carboxylesterase